jgi:multiple sugar transport system substrate-binding protein
MKLNGITWNHPRGYEPLLSSSLLYEKSFGVTVSWEKRSLTQFGDQSLAELASQFDLLIIDHPHVGMAERTRSIIPMGQLLPKPSIEKWKSQSAGPCFSSYSYKGMQWAIPIDAAMQCSAYRPDLLGSMDVPKNWMEVFLLADLLKKENLQVGMALSPTDCLCSFLTLTAQLGSPLIEGKEIMVSQDIGLQALEILRKMRDRFHPGCLDWNPIQLYDQMSTQDDLAYSPLSFCYTNYSREGFCKNKLKFSNAPGILHSLLGGTGIAISSACKYLKEAAHYVEWICSSIIQSSIYLAEQGQPAHIDAWQSESSNQLTNYFFQDTFDTLTNAYVRPRYSGWPKLQVYMGQVLHDYLKKDQDPEQLLNRLQEAYHQSY